MKEDIIKKIRRFNRYYTVWLDVMSKDYLGTDCSWPESRVLFEIFLFPEINATRLCGHLHMDKSYMSRILAKLEKNGLITRELVPGTKGMKRISLTEKGKEKAQQIDRRGSEQIAEKLGMLDEETCGRLCEGMVLIENILRETERKDDEHGNGFSL